MADPAGTDFVSVDLQPVGRRARVPRETTILAAAQASGVELVAVCGGQGTCGTCRVRHVDGMLSDPTPIEEDLFTDPEIRSGLRLACQAAVLSDVRIEIPPDSLSTTQRLQVEGQSDGVALDPPVFGIDVVLAQPALDDLRADGTRLADAVQAAGVRDVRLSLSALQEGSHVLRAQQWSARLAVHRASAPNEIVAVLPIEARLLGLAVDVGTTKVAGYLVDLATGQTVARAGAMNPQIAYGEDVVSRITHANTSAAAAGVLHERIVDTVNKLVEELCAQIGADRASIVDAVVVGNTAMHHLFVGLPVRPLGEAPYIATVTAALDIHASDVGLQLAAGATLYLPPNIAGYVGADHVSALLASDIGKGVRTKLLLDIGTNTEITLAHDGRLWSCSTASGPAFEGAHIRDGMRAVPGAIERVRFQNGGFLVHTIGGLPPVGICGSGILDAVAEGLNAGIIDARGALSKSHPLVHRGAAGFFCLLVPAARTGHDRDLILTRSDVNEIQLAKGAIRAGTELLLDAAHIRSEALQDVIVAGAFGTYLDLDSAMRVGMLPALPRERFRQVGNAAGQGAQHLLLSRERRATARDLARTVHYVELTAHAQFVDAFVRALSFEHAGED